MWKYRISGVPIVNNEEELKLVGIITNRDLRFIQDYSLEINDVMTKENLVTAPVGTTLADAEKILQQYKIEKLPIVNENGILKGLITIKDIEKVIEFPNAAKDHQDRKSTRLNSSHVSTSYAVLCLKKKKCDTQ